MKSKLSLKEWIACLKAQLSPEEIAEAEKLVKTSPEVVEMAFRIANKDGQLEDLEDQRIKMKSDVSIYHCGGDEPLAVALAKAINHKLGIQGAAVGGDKDGVLQWQVIISAKEAKSPAFVNAKHLDIWCDGFETCWSR